MNVRRLVLTIFLAASTIYFSVGGVGVFVFSGLRGSGISGTCDVYIGGCAVDSNMRWWCILLFGLAVLSAYGAFLNFQKIKAKKSEARSSKRKA